MKLKETENQIQKQILDFLAYQKNLFVWRNNTGAFIKEYKGKKSFIKAGIKGGADIIGLTNKGQFIALEVKSEKGRLNEAQQEFQQNIMRMGGLYLVVRSVEETKELLKANKVI